MVRYCYIVAEGHQDIELLIRLLKKSYGFRKVQKLSELDEFWKPLVPRTFPKDDDLMKRVPVPVFVQNTELELSIALHSAIGISNVSKTIEESLAIISASQIFGIAIVLDADSNQTPQERFQELISELSPKLSPLGLSVPSSPGEVLKNSPRCGIFIVPNNSEPGTLEDLLLECAKINYPDLLQLSTNYVSNIDRSQLNKEDLKELNKPAGENKAVLSSISSILRPGRTLQVSIEANRWIDEKTMELESIKLIKTFLDEVIGLA